MSKFVAKWFFVFISAALIYIAFRYKGSIEEFRWCFLLSMVATIWCIHFFVFEIAIEVFTNRAINENRLDEKYKKKLDMWFEKNTTRFNAVIVSLAGIGILEILSVPSDVGYLWENLLFGFILGSAVVFLYPISILSLWGPVISGQKKRLAKEDKSEPDMSKKLLCRWQRELEEQKAGIAKDEQQIAEKERQLREEEDRLLKLQEELRGRESMLEQKANELKKIERTIESTRDDLLQRQDDISSGESELRDSNATLQQEQKQLQASREDLDLREQALQTRQNGLDTREQELATRESELAQSTEELQTRSNVLEERATALETRLNEVVERENAHEQSVASLEDTATSLQNRETQIQRDLSKLEGERAALEAKRLELEAHERTLTAESQRITTAQEALTQQNEELTTFESRLKTTEAELSQRETELRAKESVVGKKASEFEQEHQEILAQKAELETARTELETARAELESQRAQIAEEKTALDAARTKNNEDVKAHAEKIRRFDTERAELLARATGAESELSELRSQQAHVQTAEIAELEQARASIAEAIGALTGIEYAAGNDIGKMLIELLDALHKLHLEINCTFTSEDVPELEPCESLDRAVAMLMEGLEELRLTASYGGELAGEAAKFGLSPYTVFMDKLKTDPAKSKQYLFGLSTEISLAVFSHWLDEALKNPETSIYEQLQAVFGACGEWEEKTIALFAGYANSPQGMSLLCELPYEALSEDLLSRLNQNAAINLAQAICSSANQNQGRIDLPLMYFLINANNNEGAEFGEDAGVGICELALAYCTIIDSESLLAVFSTACEWQDQRDAVITSVAHMISRSLLLLSYSRDRAFDSSVQDSAISKHLSPELHKNRLMQYLGENDGALPQNSAMLEIGASRLTAISKAALITLLERRGRTRDAARVLISEGSNQFLPFLNSASLYRLLSAIWNGEIKVDPTDIKDTLRKLDVSDKLLSGADRFRLCLIPICGFAIRNSEQGTDIQRAVVLGCRNAINAHHRAFSGATSRPEVLSSLDSAFQKLGWALREPAKFN